MRADETDRPAKTCNLECCNEKAYETSPKQFTLDDVFTYHAPRPDQMPKLQAIREAAKYFARVVSLNTPYSVDRSAALRKIREAVMTANAAIVLDGMGADF